MKYELEEINYEIIIKKLDDKEVTRYKDRIILNKDDELYLFGYGLMEIVKRRFTPSYDEIVYYVRFITED